MEIVLKMEENARMKVLDRTKENSHALHGDFNFRKIYTVG